MPDLKYSVIVSTRNEGMGLRRTIDSVLDASARPARNTLEIIVVDDGSTDASAEFLGAPQYRSVPIRLLRNERPIGIIHSRYLGVQHARSRYVCILDAHCWVPAGWLDQLADALAAVDDRGLAVPAIGSLDEASWSLREDHPAATACTIYNPLLDFGWEPSRCIDGRSCTCTIGGGAWMANRRWYEHIGGLDRDMVHWGGENVDLPLRTWLAGGTCLVLDELRIGHLFRAYGAPGKPSVSSSRLTYNKVRAAHSVFAAATLPRVLRNLSDLEGFEAAMEELQRDSESLGRLKGHFESVRERSDRWLIETFELPLFEAPFYHIPGHRRPSSRRRQRPHPPVTIVVTATGRSETAEQLTKSLLERTTYSRFRVLLARSRSRDGLPSFLEDAPCRTENRLDVLQTSADSSGGSLYNLAALQSESAYLIFIRDDAVLLDDHWVEEFLLLFERREQLLLAAPRLQRVGRDPFLADPAAPATFEGRWDWESPGFVSTRHGEPLSDEPYQALTVSPVCFAVHRERFLELGGFDRSVLRGEPPLLDLAIHGWLAGYEVFLDPGLYVGHREPLAGASSPQRGAPRRNDGDPDRHREIWTHYGQMLPAVKFFSSGRRVAQVRERSPAAAELLEEKRFFLDRRRREFLRYARYDDDWLFYKFGIGEPGE